MLKLHLFVKHLEEIVLRSKLPTKCTTHSKDKPIRIVVSALLALQCEKFTVAPQTILFMCTYNIFKPITCYRCGRKCICWNTDSCFSACMYLSMKVFLSKLFIIKIVYLEHVRNACTCQREFTFVFTASNPTYFSKELTTNYLSTN